MIAKDDTIKSIGSTEPYDSRREVSRQLDDGQPRRSEDDMQREELGPRGNPGKADPARMTPQREKKTPRKVDPGHTA
jgi:hypothetical protein